MGEAAMAKPRHECCGTDKLPETLQLEKYRLLYLKRILQEAANLIMA